MLVCSCQRMGNTGWPCLCRYWGRRLQGKGGTAQQLQQHAEKGTVWHETHHSTEDEQQRLQEGEAFRMAPLVLCYSDWGGRYSLSSASSSNNSSCNAPVE